jgi:uncharacterized membrane protein SpoIIM required for sporulation
VTQGFDVDRFVRERTDEWRELERMLGSVQAEGIRPLGIEGARRLGQLYRAVSSDLVRARTELADASLVDYLNDLAARAYACVHTGSSTRGRQLLAFFVEEFPRTVRHQWRPIALSAALLLSGALFGAVASARDPGSVNVMIPEQFQHVPAERVAQDEATGGSGGQAAATFSTWLFTHNIQVTFTVFALGLTFGIGTVALMFYNGAPLGALAWQYHQAGHGLFYWAWILPHGIPELTVVAIAGGAGLVLARGLWLPGRRRRRDALVAEARIAVRLVVGAMPVLIMAGLIEGTISQIHEPRLPYPLKLLFAAVVGVGVAAFLLFGGRHREATVARQPTDRSSASRSSMTSA